LVSAWDAPQEKEAWEDGDGTEEEDWGDVGIEDKDVDWETTAGENLAGGADEGKEFWGDEDGFGAPLPQKASGSEDADAARAEIAEANETDPNDWGSEEGPTGETWDGGDADEGNAEEWDEGEMADDDWDQEDEENEDEGILTSSMGPKGI
jgi:hypothetical protein